jgi:hypothetical protein
MYSDAKITGQNHRAPLDSRLHCAQKSGVFKSGNLTGKYILGRKANSILPNAWCSET